MEDHTNQEVLAATKGKALANELVSRMNRAARTARINYFFAYALLSVGVTSSLVASIMVASGTGTDLIVAALAAIPGALALVANTFRFEARAEWWFARQRGLDALHRELQYENHGAEEISARLTQLITESEKRWPSFRTLSTGRVLGEIDADPRADGVAPNRTN